MRYYRHMEDGDRVIVYFESQISLEQARAAFVKRLAFFKNGVRITEDSDDATRTCAVGDLIEIRDTDPAPDTTFKARVTFTG